MTTNPHIYDIHAYKGGVGTTTVACALAVAESHKGKTVLIDATGSNDTYAWLGLANSTEECVAKPVESVNHPLFIAHSKPGHAWLAYTTLDLAGDLQDVRTIVIDNGKHRTSDSRLPSAKPVCVVRNDYMTLRSTVGKFLADREILFLFENNGVLNKNDVRAVLGADPVVMKYDEAVQRAIDAGLAPTRHHLFAKWVKELTKAVSAGEVVA